MKVYFINTLTQRCGVSEFGRRMQKALIEAGVELVGSPTGADLIHVNWHPFTMGEYYPPSTMGEYYPPQIRDLPISAYFHDTPQFSSSLLWDVCQVRFTSEPYEGAIEVPYPATDHRPLLGPINLGRLVVGTTGVRGDGVTSIEELCKKREWIFNGPTKEWSPDEVEIDRLSWSTINVLWYYASGRGKSLALMTCAAARRPLLINRSDMFSQAWPYKDEIFIAEEGESLEEALDRAVKTVPVKIPIRLPEQLSWSRVIEERIIPAWKEIL